MSALRRLFRWLFQPSLARLLVVATGFGDVLLQNVKGVGWQCTIRPPLVKRERGRALNSWSGTSASPKVAVLEAVEEAENNSSAEFSTTECAPKLGGREFDG
jgi:hypothetical protein